MTALFIYGAGGHAREVAWLVEQIGSPYTLTGFIDDAPALHGSQINGLPVYSLAHAVAHEPQAAVVSGIGAPLAREVTMRKAAAAGLHFATLVHPATMISRWTTLGIGVVVFAGSRLTVNIRFGDHVHLNQNCTVSHDCVLGDYTTLAPGVHIAGAVHLGRRVNVGTGAVFINGTPTIPLMIGDDAVIGAGACVTKAVEAATTVVGVPARPLGRQGG